jgi:phosphoglycolate phosphatase
MGKYIADPLRKSPIRVIAEGNFLEEILMKLDNIKLIIFDLDGTLINAYPAIYRSFNHTMRIVGVQVQKESVIRRAVGWGDKNLIKPFVRKKDLEDALYLYRSHHADSLIKYSKLFPQVGAMLGRLKRSGYKLAVASNRPTRFSVILLRHLDIKKYFDFVLCGDKLKHIKPHPEVLQRIMRRLKKTPQQTLFVGDMYIDCQAGRRAKVKTIMVTTGSSSKKELEEEKPWRIVPRVVDVLKFIP